MKQRKNKMNNIKNMANKIEKILNNNALKVKQVFSRKEYNELLNPINKVHLLHLQIAFCARVLVLFELDYITKSSYERYCKLIEDIKPIRYGLKEDNFQILKGLKWKN